MVIWTIGIANSGKTTLTQLVYKRLKPYLPNLVRLDGDIIRAIFGHDVDHSVEGRRINAQRLSNLSKFLADEGVHVIAAVLSIFPEWQEWNRQNIKDYGQVYLKVSVETATRRDTKDLYARAIDGKIQNVVGIDIPFPEPNDSDLIIDNNQECDDFEDMVQKVLSLNVIQNALTGRQ